MPTPRILVFGNSGAGKSTLARHLLDVHGLAHLDLDTLAWQATSPPARRPLAQALADVDVFTTGHAGWIIEGCYSDLLQPLAVSCNLMLFLNPGVEACIAHCRQRSWEPHKYPDRQSQDANLPMLLDWVRDYPRRSDEFSLAAHRALFDGFEGRKLELTQPVDRDAIDRWLSATA